MEIQKEVFVLIYYYAGNFIHMGNKEIEKRFIKDVTKEGREYNRLSSFFFKQTENLLEIKKESHENRKK